MWLLTRVYFQDTVNAKYGFRLEFILIQKSVSSLKYVLIELSLKVPVKPVILGTDFLSHPHTIIGFLYYRKYDKFRFHVSLIK